MGHSMELWDEATTRRKVGRSGRIAEACTYDLATGYTLHGVNSTCPVAAWPDVTNTIMSGHSLFTRSYSYLSVVPLALAHMMERVPLV